MLSLLKTGAKKRSREEYEPKKYPLQEKIGKGGHSEDFLGLNRSMFGREPFNAKRLKMNPDRQTQRQGELSEARPSSLRMGMNSVLDMSNSSQVPMISSSLLSASQPQTAFKGKQDKNA